LAARAQRREGPQIRDRVALTDRAEALQEQMRAALPAYTLVLDIIHAVEYLWDAANALLGERHPERTTWVRGQLIALLRGQTDQVITALTAAADDLTLPPTQPKAIAATIRYYRRNAPYMHHDQYLARGWPIGIGVIESACGPLVKDRMEQAGMRWTKDGAHAILDLRAVRLTDDWDAYWAFHRQSQRHRLQDSAATVPASPEAQALSHMRRPDCFDARPMDFGHTQISVAVSSRMESSVPSRSCPPRTPPGAWPAACRWRWR
jgi:hypothetical protein